MNPTFATRHFSIQFRLPRSVNPWTLRRKHYPARFEHWKPTYEGRVGHALGLWAGRMGR